MERDTDEGTITMALLRIRTEIEDRPGRLAGLTAALAARGANILDLSVQVDTAGVVDEFIVDLPAGCEVAELTDGLAAADAVRTTVVPARRHDLVDEPTRALALAARLRADPRALPEALAEFLRADEARWASGPIAMEDSPDTLVVPVGHLRAVRLRRSGLPFTTTEAARADAMVRAVLPPAAPAPTSRRVMLRDGTEIVVRPVRSDDADAVRAMHERCSAESRRLRYFSAKPRLPQRVLDVFCDRTYGLTLVAEKPEGELLALAHLMHVLEPGVAELGFLVEDAWHGRGVGRILSELLVVLARERGLVEVRASVLSENMRMRRLLTSLGGTTRRTEDPAVIEVRLRLDGRSATAPPRFDTMAQ